jgi:hypothetical protein
LRNCVGRPGLLVVPCLFRAHWEGCDVWTALDSTDLQRTLPPLLAHAGHFSELSAPPSRPRSHSIDPAMSRRHPVAVRARFAGSQSIAIAASADSRTTPDAGAVRVRLAIRPAATTASIPPPRSKTTLPTAARVVAGVPAGNCAVTAPVFLPIPRAARDAAPLLRFATSPHAAYRTLDPSPAPGNAVRKPTTAAARSPAIPVAPSPVSPARRIPVAAQGRACTGSVPPGRRNSAGRATKQPIVNKVSAATAYASTRQRSRPITPTVARADMPAPPRRRNAERRPA